MNNIKVTVVIPIYKVEKYLNECILSVVNQTYKNLEIILVDDESPDRCPQICDDWEKKDHRIKVIHKKNGGLGYARNSGIDIATGDYIVFVDSDDYIDSSTVEECVNVVRQNNFDIICYGYKNVRDGKVIAEHPIKTIKEIFLDEEIHNILLPEMICSTGIIKMNMSACMCFINLKLIREVNWRFSSEKVVISEDVCSLLELYKNVNCVYLLNNQFYNYRINPNSISHSYDLDFYKKIEEFSRYLKSRIVDYSNYNILNKHISSLIFNYVIAYVKSVFLLSKENRKHAILNIFNSQVIMDDLGNVNLKSLNLKKRLLLYSMLTKRKNMTYCLFKIR